MVQAAQQAFFDLQLTHCASVHYFLEHHLQSFPQPVHGHSFYSHHITNGRRPAGNCKSI